MSSKPVSRNLTCNRVDLSDWHWRCGIDGARRRHTSLQSVTSTI
jgi:hypothetical protein